MQSFMVKQPLPTLKGVQVGNPAAGSGGQSSTSLPSILSNPLPDLCADRARFPQRDTLQWNMCVLIHVIDAWPLWHPPSALGCLSGAGRECPYWHKPVHASPLYNGRLPSFVGMHATDARKGSSQTAPSLDCGPTTLPSSGIVVCCLRILSHLSVL